MKESFNILTNRAKEIKKEKENLDKQYELDKNLWELQQELIEYENKYKEQIKLEPEIEARRIKLKASENAWKVKPFLEAVKDIEEKIATGKLEIEKLNKQLQFSSDLLLKKETEYKSILQQREKELPRLIEKETNLAAALERLNKLKDIKAEREVLLKQYNEKKALLNEVNKKSEAVTNKLTKIEDEKVAAEKRLEELVVDPSYRDDINKLVVLQDEDSKLKDSIRDLK